MSRMKDDMASAYRDFYSSLGQSYQKEDGATEECEGCEGKGTYQLLGPVMECEKCEGKGRVPIKVVEAPPPTEKKYPNVEGL